MAKKQDAEAQQDNVQLVKMVRDAEMYPEPHEAEVHPDEVENFKLDGWNLTE